MDKKTLDAAVEALKGANALNAKPLLLNFASETRNALVCVAEKDKSLSELHEQLMERLALISTRLLDIEHRMGILTHG